MKKIINYSGIAGLVLISALFFLSVSCNKDTVENNPNADSNSQLIKVSGEDANAATKTTLSGFVTSWAITDKVGIYSPQAHTETGSVGSAIVNAQFTAASSGVSSNFNGTMYWGAANSSHTFYAYYPWASGAAASTVVPISLSSAQTQSAAGINAHIGALDFMVATPVTITSPNNTNPVANDVNLRYNHVFTVLEFQITGSGTLNAVKLSSTSKTVAFSGGTIDLNQTPTAAPYTFVTQTGTTTQTVVTLTTPATLSGTVQKVYMVINPSTASENYYIGFLSGLTWTYITKAAPYGGFLRGKKYVVAIRTTDASSAPDGAPIDPAIDPDGNTYGTVTIGTQTWMAENLKTTKYNDGSAITSVTNAASYDYNNTSTPSNSAIYGKLYNWHAVNTGKLCPTGWHVPTDAEWTTLTTYLGGTSVAGDKLKETGTTHWISNTAATNSSGFTALPGGYRYQDGSINYVGSYGYWWSSTARDGTNAWNCQLSTDVYRGFGSYVTGFSVRCVRDK